MVILATSYLLEIRPAGVQAPWSAVDAPDRPGDDCCAGRFRRESSSCRVSGLLSNVVFEVRITYYTACGCHSDASDASEWCMACPSAVPLANPSLATMQHSTQLYPPICASTGFPRGGTAASWPSEALPPHLTASAAGLANPLAWQTATHVEFAPPLADHLHMGLQSAQRYSPTPSWCCMHGAIVPPPSAPQVGFADDTTPSIIVQWLSMSYATAYVVELQEAHRTERFLRSVPQQASGALIELIIRGLHPSEPGRCYSVQVRCVAACGCESEASPISTLHVPLAQPLAGSLQLPSILPAPSHPCIPPAYGPSCYGQEQQALQQLPRLLIDPMGTRPSDDLISLRGKQAAQLASHVASAYASKSNEELPSLLALRMPMPPPPSRPAPKTFGPAKETPHEVLGKELPRETASEHVDAEDEDDCIILD